jgi:hypothetical protein
MAMRYRTIKFYSENDHSRTLIIKVKSTHNGTSIVYPKKYRAHNTAPHYFLYEKINAISKIDGMAWNPFSYTIIGQWKR